MHSLKSFFRQAGGLLALLPLAAQAAPVLLDVSSTGSATQHYFGAAPAPWATVSLVGDSLSWSLQPGVTRRVRYNVTENFTGPTGGCCTAQTHSFGFGLTVAGVTQQLDVEIEAMQINNGQFQFNTLNRADTVFNLGALGQLTLDFLPSANQVPEFLNGGGVVLFANATLVAAPQGVALPGSLSLAALGLALLAAPRARRSVLGEPGCRRSGR